MKFSILALCLFISTIVPAQINIYDGFDDNSNEWPDGKSEWHSLGVKNGAFEVMSLNDGSWMTSKNTAVDLKKYFRYELTVEQVSMKSADQGTGLTWGVRGDTTCFMFLVYNDGSFAVINRTSLNSQTEVLKRQKHPAVKSGSNNLRMEHKLNGEIYCFSINEQLVGTAKYVVPATTEFGMISDMPATARFDNFWLVQDDHSREDYAPSNLRSGPCGEGRLRYTNTYSLYSLCLPQGWRVDETGTFANIWTIQNHIGAAGIRVSYSTIPPQEDYSIVAAGDFSSIVDSTAGISEVNRSEPQSVAGVREGTEAWKFSCTFKYQSDGVFYKVIRYYVFNKSTGQLLLFQIQLPVNRQDVWEKYDGVAAFMISSIAWPVE